jgi:predicted amidohydrolase YtcJ
VGQLEGARAREGQRRVGAGGTGGSGPGFQRRADRGAEGGRPNTTAAELDRFEDLQQRWSGPAVKAGAVKIVLDGVIESHTAALLAPCADEPSLSGSPNYSQEEIDRLVAELDRRGFQIFTHAIGDRAVRMVLDALARSRSG